jgi:hypothetical protein
MHGFSTKLWPYPFLGNLWAQSPKDLGIHIAKTFLAAQKVGVNQLYYTSISY